MSMDILIREPDGVRRAGALVIGQGVPLGTTAGGLPELLASPPFGEAQLMPSGGDDTQAIRDALASGRLVRLGPGTFTVNDIIQIGTGQSIVGCGPDRTTLKAVVPLRAPEGIVVLSGSAALEGLTLIGHGWSTFLTVAVQANPGANPRLRSLRIEEVERGISIQSADRAHISDIRFGRIGYIGIEVNSGKQVAIENVEVGSDVSLLRGLLLSSIEGLRCESIAVQNAEDGIFATGSALAFQGIRLAYCLRGMAISGSGIEVSGVDIVDSYAGFAVQNCTGAALNGCSTLRGIESTLSITGCTAVTANGFHSDMSGASGGAPPHVVVGGGSTQVMVSGIHRVNPATAPQYEVDVSGAGGRVLFAQHDFDPARINSGGNFVAL